MMRNRALSWRALKQVRRYGYPAERGRRRPEQYPKLQAVSKFWGQLNERRKFNSGHPENCSLAPECAATSITGRELNVDILINPRSCGPKNYRHDSGGSMPETTS